MLSAATDASQRGRAYSVHGFTGSLGFGAPPAIVAAGELLGVGWRGSLGFIAAVGAIYAVVCLVAVRRYVGPEVTRPPQSRDETDGESSAQRRRRSVTDRLGAFLRAVRGVVSVPAMLLLTALWFVSSMASWGVRQYTATLLGAYGLGVADANLVVAVTLGLGAVLVFGAGWLADRLSVGPVLLAGYALLAVVAGLLAWAGLPVLAAVPLALLLSPAVDSSRPARAKLADLLSADDDVGKNFGLLTIGISGGGAVAPPVLGVVVETAGVRTAFVAIAGMGALALVLTAVVLAATEDATDAAAEPTP
jgi:MFS family permease